MTVNSEAKILIVDDDPQIQRALRLALSAKGYNVSVASSGEQALDMAALDNPDLMILDLSLPGITGLDVCRELRTWSRLPVIVLSVRNKEEDKISALDLGADDYIEKPFKTGELLARIRAALRRAAKTGEKAVYLFDNLKIDRSRHMVFLDGQELKLTRTEYNLLLFLAENSDRVINHGLVLSRVWGPEYETEIRTLRVHIANLRKKIEKDPNRPRFIITEPGVGYRFASPLEKI